MGKVTVNDLIKTLNKNTIKPQKITSVTQQLGTRKTKIVQKISKSRLQAIKRQSNYQATQEQLDKWVGIVKINRQKDTIDFTHHDKVHSRVNFFQTKPISEFHKKIDEKLKKYNLINQKTVIKNENKVLNQIDGQEAKRRLAQARKHRSLIFHQEQKMRRISKIKSKLYHRIKKRQKLRIQNKQIQMMGPQQRANYTQKLMKKRIRQRLTLRHTNKSRHIQNLLRFSKNNKQSVQTSINEVNELKRMEMERVDEQISDNGSDNEDNDNYADNAIEELQNQISLMQEEKNEKIEGINGMKFMQIAKNNKKQQQKKQAQKLLKKLQKNAFNQQDYDKQQQIQSESNKQQFPKHKQIYGNQNYQINDEQKRKKISYIEKNLRTIDETKLTSGIDINSLKAKYAKDQSTINVQQTFKKNQDLLKGLYNEAAIENMRDFSMQKMAQYEKEAGEGKKQGKLKGWGCWIGPGIKQKTVDPQIEVRKKLAKIEEIKQRRKDGKLMNVSIYEHHNKNLSDYLVLKLPHQYKSEQQFNYLQKQPIGLEWNTMTQFTENIKPKVITQPGKIIEPIKPPKYLKKYH